MVASAGLTLLVVRPVGLAHRLKAVTPVERLRVRVALEDPQLERAASRLGQPQEPRPRPLPLMAGCDVQVLALSAVEAMNPSSSPSELTSIQTSARARTTCW